MAIARCPIRTASIRPGVPIWERALNSSGSAKLASMRRHSIAQRPQPVNGPHHGLTVFDDDVLPFEQHHAEVTRDIGVFRSKCRFDGPGVMIPATRGCLKDALASSSIASRKALKKPREFVDMRARETARGKSAPSPCGFSSAKPAPEGACVRSPRTNHEPSGERPISKARKMQIMTALRLNPHHRAQPLRRARDQLGGQMSVADQLRRPRRDRPWTRSNRSARWDRPAQMCSHSSSCRITGIWLSGQARFGQRIVGILPVKTRPHRAGIDRRVSKARADFLG